MSNEVFPTLPGLTFPEGYTPLFSTIVETGVDLSELRITYMTAPVYDLTLSFDFLDQRANKTQFANLVGFFEARLGAADSFLLTVPPDNNVSAMQFGTGNGSATQFQLARTRGGFNTPVCWINGNATVTVNNAAANYTVSNTGMVTFNSAPAANAALRWTGQFYYRARFKDDMAEFSQFMYRLYELGQIKLRASLGAQIR